MPRDVCHHKLTGAVLGTVLGTLLIIAGSAGTALAADDDGEGFYDQRLLRSFLRGLGLSNGREGTIEYKERPPLVVPPTRDLPQPETTGSIAPRDPSWPPRPGSGRRWRGRGAGELTADSDLTPSATRQAEASLKWGDQRDAE
jgi:hypothetical protein